MNSSCCVVQVFRCPCNPDKTYKTKQTFRKHFESKKHQIYQQHNNKVNDAKRIQELEVELKKMIRERDIWKEKYFELEYCKPKRD